MAAPDINTMPGKYAVKGTVFDPLNLATKYDLNWLREAELKHGRTCMLAIVGWLGNDYVPAIKFPGAELAGVSSLDAHDVTAKTGHLWALLFVVGVCELLHMSVIVPRLDGDWGDYEPGNCTHPPDFCRTHQIASRAFTAAKLGLSLTRDRLPPLFFFRRQPRPLQVVLC